MTPKQYRKYRILFVRSGCIFCKLYYKIVERKNQKVPIEKRIKVIFCDYANEGVYDPLLQLLNKQVTGFPTLIFDGQVYSGANSEVEIETLLNFLLFKDYIIPESNDLIFDAEKCEYQRKGIFKGRVICQEN